MSRSSTAVPLIGCSDGRLRRRIAPPPPVRSDYFREESADVREKQVRGLVGCPVPATVVLVPLNDVRVVAFGELARRLEVVAERGQADRHGRRFGRRQAVVVLEVEPGGGGRGVGEPVDRDVGEQFVVGHRIHDQLPTPGELPVRRVRQGVPEGVGLRPLRGVVDGVVEELLPEVHQHELLLAEALQLAQFALGKGEDLVDVHADDPVRGKAARLGRHDGAAVVAVHAVPVVSQAVHQFVERRGHAHRAPAGGAGGPGEREPGVGRDHHLEGVGGVSAVGPRIGQFIDQAQEFGEGAGPAVSEHQRGHVGLRRLHVEGHLARHTAPDGTTESWTYDGEGNCTSHTDPVGGVTLSEYTHPAHRTHHSRRRPRPRRRSSESDSASSPS
ncbi:RHS repeat domain-containing protein [Streptomyces mirabilis]